MVEYQKSRLEQYGFGDKGSDGDYPTFTRTTQLSKFSVVSEIELKVSPDPDLSTYRGTVRLVSDGFTLGKYESDRRYKLMDVLAEVTKVENLLQAFDKAQQVTDEDVF